MPPAELLLLLLRLLFSGCISVDFPGSNVVVCCQQQAHLRILSVSVTDHASVGIISPTQGICTFVEFPESRRYRQKFLSPGSRTSSPGRGKKGKKEGKERKRREGEERREGRGGEGRRLGFFLGRKSPGCMCCKGIHVKFRAASPGKRKRKPGPGRYTKRRGRVGVERGSMFSWGGFAYSPA